MFSSVLNISQTESSPELCIYHVHSLLHSHSEGNGFNPVWIENCEFDILNPDLALLRFEALNEGNLNLIGQAVFPVPCLKTGFRSIPLKNAWNEELELSTLLVYVEIRRTEDGQIYSKMRWERWKEDG